MGSLIAFLIERGVSAKWARPLAYAGLILVLVSALGVGKCTYDRAIISRHEAKQEARQARADRKADSKAADERRADDSRSRDEAQQTKEAIDAAKREGRNPRAAYYACIRLQQAARREHKPSPDC